MTIWMTDNELRVHVRRYKETGDPEAWAVISQQVGRMVDSMAADFVRRGSCGNETQEDLVQLGWMGVMKAIDKFDFREGVKFLTYAIWWTRAAIQRDGQAAGAAMTMPNHMIEKRNKAARARAQLSQELKRKPTVSEIAERAGVEPYYAEILFFDVDSLDRDINSDGGSLGDFIPDHFTDTEGEALDNATAHEIRQAVNSLPKRERELLASMFGIGKQPISPYRLRQKYKDSKVPMEAIYESAVTKLRESLGDFVP